VAYGARLLSGLRVTPSRGFKSRHLRRPTSMVLRGRTFDRRGWSGAALTTGAGRIGVHSPGGPVRVRVG
jgi:hypothetical protein